MSTTYYIDALGLKCPEPLILLRNKIRAISSGDIVHILSDDPVSLRDIPAFCNFMEHILVKMPDSDNLFIIQKK